MNLVVRLLIATAVLFAGMEPIVTQGQTTAVRANDFLNSIGSCTHISQGADAESNVATCLKYAGIRNIRDDGSTSSTTLQAFNTLHAATGAKVSLLPINGNVASSLSEWETLSGSGALLDCEEPNEPNNGPVTYDGATSSSTNSLPIAWFCRDIYTAVKADTKLTGIPVFASSEAGGSQPNNCGLQFLTIPATASGSACLLPVGTAFADYANTHNYVCAHYTTVQTNNAWGAEDPQLNGAWDGMYVEYCHTWWSPGYNGYTVAQLPTVPRVTTETGWPTGNTYGPVNFTYGSGTPFATNVTTGASRNNLTGWVGFEFTVGATALTVNQVGRWVISGNSGTHPVEIVQVSGTTGTVIATGTVSTSGSTAGAFAYAPITPVTLTANTSYYVLSSETSGGDSWYDLNDWVSTTTSGTITNAEYYNGSYNNSGIGISQDSQGKLFMNLYLSAYDRGWSNTFVYYLHDTSSQGYWGFFDSGYNAKLSGVYLHNFTTILSDTTSSFTPASLNYSIPSEPTTVHDMLMQNSSGVFLLAVWDDRPAGSGTDTVTVDFGSTYQSVSIYDPTAGTSVVQTLNNVSSASLSLTDHPMIIALTTLPVVSSALTATATNSLPFSYQITATNSPTSYAATGLPSGLSVNTSTGLISGTPTATGTDNVTISAVNSTGTGSATLVLTVMPPPPAITSALTATATNGLAFSYQITATNSPTSYAASGLPSGISVNTSTGLISGTTLVTGTSNVAISAMSASGTGNATLVLTVLPPPPPAITSALTATATNGLAFSYQITASNNPASFVASGLPSGLSVNTSTGVISGTTTVTGTNNVTIEAVNVSGTGSATLVLISTPTLLIIQDDFSQPNYDTGTHTPYNIYGTDIWDGDAGAGLPPNYGTTPGQTKLGIDLPGGVWRFGSGADADYDAEETGNLPGYGETSLVLTGGTTQVPFAHLHNNEGVAITTGTFNTNALLTISIAAAPGSGAAYVGFDSALNVTNNFSGLKLDGTGGLSLIVSGTQVGTTVPYTGSFSGSTATQLSFSVNTITGAISKISLQGSTSTYNFTTAGFTTAATAYVALYGPAGGSNTASFAGLTVQYTPMTPPPVINSALTATAANGAAFSYQITASNNPTSFAASGLPSGLSVNTSTGLISGTTTATGTATVTISAINVGGTGSATLALTVLPPPPVIGSSLSATASNSVAFSYQITASNTPTSFAASGLPSGLSVNTSTGLISGTTTATGTSDVTISAINAGGTGNATLVLTVLPPPPVITSALTATATNGAAFSYQISASNSPTSYSASGLPSGLSVNTSTGQISGTTTATGTSNATISASNAGGTGSATLVLTVLPPKPVISSALTATATNGAAFSYQIAASNSPTSYSASGLPSGLTVNTSTGLISGTTTATGTDNVTINAINTGGTGTATLALTVLPPPPVISSTLTATATNGTAFTYQITASNSPTSFTASGLPSGLSVNTSTGLITGTTTATGTSNATISASNAGGTGSAALVLTVLPPKPVISSALTATATNGAAFSYQITATNNPTSYGAASLPAGLSVNAATGLISGTVTATGTAGVTISASNSGGTGSASLAIAIQTSYGAWQNHWFTAAQLANSSISGDTADPAGDGISNLLKYALNLNPLAGQAAAMPTGSIVTISGSNYLRLSYTQQLWAGDLTYLPEVSGDLKTWNTGNTNVSVISSTPNADGVTESITVQDLTPSTPNAPRYIRLMITGP